MREPTNHASVENSNLIPGSSYSCPAPLGMTVRTTIERGDAYSAPEIYDVEITLLEIVRGKEAWERIKAQGVAGDLLKSGYEYILARIKLGYFRKGRAAGGEVYKLVEGQFAAVSPDGQTEYDIPSGLPQPHPQLIDGTLSPGESREGWILLQVPKDEKKPRLIFKRQNVEGVHEIWGHVWFQLYYTTRS